MSCFLEPYDHNNNTIELELDLSNHATKSGLKYARFVDILTFAKKDDLTNLKPELHKLDNDKSKTFSADLSKLSNVLKKLGVMNWLKKWMLFRLLKLVI